MKLTPRIYLIGYVGLIAAFFFAVYRPLSAKQSVAEASIASTTAQLADFEQTVAQLPVYLQSKTELQSRLEDLNSKLYSKHDVLILFQQLRTSAQEYGLRVNEIVPPVEEMLALNNVAPNADEPQFLNITLYLCGNYLNFGRFCEQLEQQGYYRGTNFCLMQTQPGEHPTIHYGFKALLGTEPQHD